MEYQNLNDYEVLYMIQESDETAFFCMYEKYKPLINKLSKDFLKKYNAVGIEYDDLYQQGMIGLTEAINNYKEKQKTSFFTFAYLCVKREMNKLITSSIRNKNNIINFSMSMDYSLSNDNDSLNNILFNKKDFTDFNCYKRINEENLYYLKYKLKDEYMPIYELKINGFSNKEISLLLDIPYKKVDNYLTSIKNKLKKIENNIIE